MEHISPETKEDLEEAVNKAVEVLGGGGLIIYPTDTLYGIGVDATNKEAIENVFTLKGRVECKPLSVIVSDLKMAEEYAIVPTLANKLAERMLPGPLTLLLPKKDVLPEALTKDSPTLGIRIPDSYISVATAEKLGRPFTTTSANKSGMTATSVDDILEQLKKDHDMIDLVIDVGELKGSPSTVLEIDENSVRVIREGNMNMQAVMMVMHPEEKADT